MKTIGLMGGSDYKNTIRYLDAINEQLNETCKSVTYTLNPKEMNTKDIIYYSDVLRQAGASFLVLCEEVLHEISKDIRRNLSINLLHIGECLADELIKQNIKKVLVLGTREIMLADYYVHALNRKGIKVARPEIEVINRIQDYLDAEEKDDVKLISIIESFRLKGVSGVIMTCDFAVDYDHLSMHVFDSFEIHIKSIINELK